MCARGGGILDEGDTPVSPASFDVALLALGAILQCCDAVIDGTVQRAFAAIRPPGHHAEPNHPMGFCLFANVAIAAKYLQQKHNLQKIAIVDFDVHHGNGTEAILIGEPRARFCSIHQHPCYPGTGLKNADVFFLGNLVGETGDGTTLFRVNALDLAAVKRSLGSASTITGRLDFNRDGRVNALDLAATRAGQSQSLSLSTPSGQ